MSGVADNKRKHERHAVNCALIVRDGEQRIGVIEDISRGGMRVKLDGDLGENEDVREWTGKKSVDNREFVLNNQVGNEFDLALAFLAINLGHVKARLVRVIRSMNRLYFAMQFTQADPALIERVMGIVKRGAKK